MKISPFMLGAGLIFWGAHSGMLWPGVMLAILVESARWVPRRWRLETADFRRAAETAILLAGGAALYCFLTRDYTNGLMRFFQWGVGGGPGSDGQDVFSRIFFLWSPLYAAPLILAQLYSSGNRIPGRAFQLLTRNRGATSGNETEFNLDGRPVYFAICFAAACETNHGRPWFYFSAALLVAWLLWIQPPARRRSGVWLGLFGACVVAGFHAHTGLRQLQARVEANVVNWIAGMGRDDLDAREIRTAMGRVGDLKLSGRIALRVYPGAGPVPERLMEASYNTLHGVHWRAGGSTFRAVTPSPDFNSWRLASTPADAGRIEISMYLPGGEAILPLPAGTTRLSALPAGGLSTNQHGAARVSEGPGLARFEVRHDGAARGLQAPGPADLNIPPALRSAVSNTWNRILNFPENPSSRPEVVAKYFAAHFRYVSSLQQPPDTDVEEHPLAYFLEASHEGHCELFATAAVMLLRGAGIPARYAVGYALQEYDEEKHRIVARDRHAHAWCLYFQDGRWRDLDATPPDWSTVDAQHASRFERWRDALSDARHAFASWRWLNRNGSARRVLLAALGLVMVCALWRILRHRGRAQHAESPPPVKPWVARGSDSEFYLIQRHFEGRGFQRVPGETLQRWLRRLQSESGVNLDSLRPILALHYRHRFDPAGVSLGERRRLRGAVRHWLTDAAVGSGGRDSN